MVFVFCSTAWSSEYIPFLEVQIRFFISNVSLCSIILLGANLKDESCR